MPSCSFHITNYNMPQEAYSKMIFRPICGALQLTGDPLETGGKMEFFEMKNLKKKGSNTALEAGSWNSGYKGSLYMGALGLGFG